MKIFLLVYDILWYLACPFIALLLVIKGRKLPSYRKRLYERFGLYCSRQPVDIWCHAVSVGEVVAASGIVEKSLALGYQVLMTTMTPTGSEQVKRMWGDQVEHQYCPYDFSFAIQRFLKDRKPRLFIVFETELWPGILASCHQKAIPCILGNARISNRSYGSYLKTSWIWKHLLAYFQKIYVQSPKDEERFLKIGAKSEQLEMTGNLKFQTLAPHPEKIAFWQAFKSNYPQHIFWVVGSTHHGEEEQILKAWQDLHQSFPKLILILAPRHPERFERVFQYLRQNKVKNVQRLSSWNADDQLNILLVDQMGELSSLYSIANFAFVGGSLVPVGGHNVLEPLYFGVPVMTGPYTQNQQDLVRLLLQEDAIIITKTSSDLTQSLSMLLIDAKKYQAIQQKSLEIIHKYQGSLEKHMQGVIDVLEN